MIVSHSLGLVEKMCDEVLWLRKGRKADQGDPKRVIDAYLIYVAGGEEALLRGQERAAQDDADAAAARAALRGAGPPRGAGAEEAMQQGLYRQGRWGSREVEITRCASWTSAAASATSSCPGRRSPSPSRVRAEKPVQDFVFGLGLFTADGVSVYGTNTHLEDHVARKIEGEGEVRIVLEDLRLVEGTYLVDVAAHRKDGTPYDYHRGQLSFRVKSRLKDVGVYRPLHRFEFAGGVSVAAPQPRPELDLEGGEGE